MANTNTLKKEEIEKILAEIDPYLMSHGGGVELLEINDLDVKIRIKGSCVGCPASSMTFGLGLEQMLREKIPHIKNIFYVS